MRWSPRLRAEGRDPGNFYDNSFMLLLKLVRGAEFAAGVRTLVQVQSQLARFVIGRDPKCDWPIPDRELAL